MPGTPHFGLIERGQKDCVLTINGLGYQILLFKLRVDSLEDDGFGVSKESASPPRIPAWSKNQHHDGPAWPSRPRTQSTSLLHLNWIHNTRQRHCY